MEERKEEEDIDVSIERSQIIKFPKKPLKPPNYQHVMIKKKKVGIFIVVLSVLQKRRKKEFISLFHQRAYLKDKEKIQKEQFVKKPLKMIPTP